MDRKELTQTVKEMIAAPSCCQELKAAGEKWLNAADTAEEKAAAAALLQEIRRMSPRLSMSLNFLNHRRQSRSLVWSRRNQWRNMLMQSKRQGANGVTAPPAQPD